MKLLRLLHVSVKYAGHLTGYKQFALLVEIKISAIYIVVNCNFIVTFIVCGFPIF